ncbi:MAG: hypothetical protein ACLFV7_03250 [Phycisphaerae bacterium]
MIYLALTVWLFAILFAGLGVYRLWAGLVKPKYVGWALLPGTLVCELAYILGCLITGGEVRRARLIPSGDSRGPRSADPTTEDTPKLKVIGPVVASLLALLAGVSSILVVRWLLGEPVIETFVLHRGLLAIPSLPKELPGSWDGLWGLLAAQVDLLRHTFEFWPELEWTHWRVPLFVYLTTCLAVRLAPGGRDLRWSLLAAAVLAGGIAVAALASDRFAGLMEDVWPLLTYLWALLLFLLAVTGLIYAGVGIVNVLRGKK